jgi:uncharacterized damage-inducible protein DinB
MKDVFLTFIRSNRNADAAVLSILEKLSPEERDKERGSYYHSLSGLVRHIIGCGPFFCGMFKAAVPGNAAALKALAPIDALPKDAEPQWGALVKTCGITDEALVNFTAALSEADFAAEVTAPWGASSLAFALQNFIAHGIHHRGQISQILDELHIDNDFSAVKGE